MSSWLCLGHNPEPPPSQVVCLVFTLGTCVSCSALLIPDPPKGKLPFRNVMSSWLCSGRNPEPPPSRIVCLIFTLGKCVIQRLWYLIQLRIWSLPRTSNYTTCAARQCHAMSLLWRLLGMLCCNTAFTDSSAAVSESFDLAGRVMKVLRFDRQMVLASLLMLIPGLCRPDYLGE